MTLDTDFHGHIAGTSAQVMIQAAKERGLRVQGLSEHIFQMREARPLLDHMPLEGPLLTLSDYSRTVHETASELHLDVRLGLEVDFIPDEQERILSTIQNQPLDFLIGSVHQVDGQQFEGITSFEPEEGKQMWLRYFALLRAAVQSKRFNVVSHPVRMRSTNPYVPANLDAELEQLAAEAAHHDVALEINGYDLLTYPTLVQRLARACALHSTPISVGSDAHRPSQVARVHPQSEALLREVGISKVRIWKQRQNEEYSF